mmetsp:Transcript_27289/g.74670  ORF Transcript_27289/g.74670 Transcript_27289/m.74670 type:complete len:83 (+) Transcript_27289:1017-1265(+)
MQPGGEKRDNENKNSNSNSTNNKNSNDNNNGRKPKLKTTHQKNYTTDKTKRNGTAHGTGIPNRYNVMNHHRNVKTKHNQFYG